MKSNVRDSVHVLLNMFLNFISSEVILLMYFEIQGFQRNCGLSYIHKLKVELDFQNNSVDISVGKLNKF